MKRRRVIIIAVVVGVVVAALALGLGLGLGLGLSSGPVCTSTNSPKTCSNPPCAVGAAFYTSDPVRPNETLMITGGIWTKSDPLVVILTRLDDASTATFPPVSRGNSATPAGTTPIIATILAQTDFSISVLVPDNLSPGVFAYQIWRGPLNTSAVPSELAAQNELVVGWTLANAPKIWSHFGDQGRTASPGGFLGAFGVNMMMSTSSARLVDLDTGASFSLSMSRSRGSDRWGVYFDIPSNVPFGNYSLWVHNGRGGSLGWSKYYRTNGPTREDNITIEESREKLWGQRVIDVNTVNATTLDKKVAAAFQNLTNSTNGGVLYFPAGTYTLFASLNIPAKVIVRGDGIGRTILNFASATYSWNLVTGSKGFGLEHFSIYPSLVNLTVNQSCGVTIVRKFGKEYSWVKSVHVLEPTDEDKAMSTTCPYTCGTRIGAAIVIAGAENFAAEDFQIDDCKQGFVTESNSNYTRCTNCRIKYRDADFNLRCGMSHVVEDGWRHFLDNGTISCLNYVGWQPGLLIGEYCGTSVTRDIYYANMTSTADQYTWNDNTNADGKEGWYYGQVDCTEGTKLTLSDVIHTPVYQAGAPAYTSSTNLQNILGSVVTIVGGHGTGQMRFLTSVNYDPSNTVITIDEPFDVPPDSTSWLAISKIKGRNLLVNNDFRTEGLHQSGWFGKMETIYADNIVGTEQPFQNPCEGSCPSLNPNGNPNASVSMTFQGGFRYGDAANNFIGALSGHWYSQALDNTIRASTPTGFSLSIGAWSGFPSGDTAWGKQGTFGNVLRGNNNINASVPFTISLDTWVGHIVVEGNKNLKALTYRGYNGASLNMVARANTPSNVTAGISYTCGVYSCGKGKWFNSTTEDCFKICGGTKQYFY